MEAYRSGHNGTDSKSVVPHGTVGSNPTASANIKGTPKWCAFYIGGRWCKRSLLLRSKIGFGFESKPSVSLLTSGVTKKSR